MRYIGHGLVFLVLFALGAVAGDIVVDGAFKSTQATGPPLEVASSDMVMNLNADQVDGVEGTDLYTKAEVDVLLAGARAADNRREYYLTDADYLGNQPLTACATGFHFANLYELSQPSSLRYAFDHPDAKTNADSGNGPPAGQHGFIRTGSPPEISNFSNPGLTNCNAWTSTGSVPLQDSGTVISLPANWADPAEGVTALVWGTPWGTMNGSCFFGGPVWCVAD